MNRLGLPDSGRGSMASVGRRVGGLVVDWLVAMGISVAFFHYDPLATLLVFAVLTVISVGTLGASLGHLVTGIRIRRLAAAQDRDWSGSGAPGPWLAVVRTVLLCAVIPAVIWDSDGRGMHDRWAGTVPVLV